MVDARTPHAAAVLAILAGLTFLIAGCGGGNDKPATPTPAPPAPTQAPTLAPTPPPTPAPTQPPTDSWAKAVCSWKEQGGTVTELEAGCDAGGAHQLRIATITVVSEQKPLGLSETCDQACTAFLDSVCSQGKRDEKACSCKTNMKGQTREEWSRCDTTAKVKYTTHKVTTPGHVPYPDRQTCEQFMDEWVQGQENAHPNACTRGNSSVVFSDVLV